VFSFGQNLISSHEEVCNYLKKLKNKLQVLKMADNPYSYQGQNDADYKLYTVQVLKNLKYLDYELIDENMRKKAFDKYNDTLNESQSNADKAMEGEKETDNELKDANIDCTDRIFNKIIDVDENTRELKLVQKFNDFWHNTEE